MIKQHIPHALPDGNLSSLSNWSRCENRICFTKIHPTESSAVTTSQVRCVSAAQRRAEQQGYGRCWKGTWNAWVIRQMQRTFHPHDRRRSFDGVCSSSADGPGSRIQMLRKPRMCKLHSLWIIRSLLRSPLGTFKYLEVADTLKIEPDFRNLNMVVKWGVVHVCDVLSSEWFTALVTQFQWRKWKCQAHWGTCGWLFCFI